jgi:hypothetical protein
VENPDYQEEFRYKAPRGDDWADEVILCKKE